MPTPEPAPCEVVAPAPVAVPCPTVEPVRCPRCPATLAGDKLVLGEIENVQVDPPGFTYTARIDSGAEGTSIHAENIQEFERDGEKWIRFDLQDPTSKTLTTLERRKAGRVRVKKLGDTLDRRVRVIIKISVGKLNQQLEVSLTDRGNFEFPVLIGRNFLRDVAVVDVSQRNIAK